MCDDASVPLEITQSTLNYLIALKITVTSVLSIEIGNRMPNYTVYGLSEAEPRFISINFLI